MTGMIDGMIHIKSDGTVTVRWWEQLSEEEQLDLLLNNALVAAYGKIDPVQREDMRRRFTEAIAHHSRG